MLWDPRRLEVLLAIARQRSFTRAAEDLAMTQPAVSRQLRALERELGVTLISRGSRHVALTPAGAALAAEAQTLVPGLEAVRRRMSEFRDPRGGAVRLGAVPSALAELVPSAVDGLRALRPNVEITVEEGWSADLAREIARGDLDLAVISAVARPPGMRSRPLRSEPYVAMLARGHRLARRRRLRLADLADEPWLVASEPGGQRAVRELCAAAGFRPRIAGTTTWDAAGPLVATGVGVALAPASTAGRIAGREAIAVRPLADGPEQQLVIVRPGPERATAAADDLERALLEAVRGGSAGAPRDR